MMIDSLTHVTPDGKWFNTEYDASTTRLLKEMDNAGLDKAVVVALAGHIENDFVLSECRKHSDRLIPGASLDPSSHATPSEAAREARELLDGGEFDVLKLHPRLNGYDPLDPRCLALLEEMSSFSKKVPVWLDTIFRNGKCLLSHPPVETMHRLAQLFPEQPFVLLHGGGPLLLQVTELLIAHPNLTVDISHTLNYYLRTSIAQDILFLLERRDMRVCAGSDFPEFTPDEFLTAFNSLADQVELDSAKRQRVLGENLSDLLG